MEESGRTSRVDLFLGVGEPRYREEYDGARARSKHDRKAHQGL